MNNKPFVITEHYYPKEGKLEEVMDILLASTGMVEKVAGVMMSLSLRPVQKNAAVTAMTLWENREHFLNFMKSEHAEEIMKSGLAEKVKALTTKISAEQYAVEKAWHVESHN